MAEEKTYRISVQGVVVEVTKTVYHTYHQMERHARHLEEKDRQHGLVSYHALDTIDTLGEEALPSPDAASVEDAAIAHILQERLHQCLELLPAQDRELIHALYFEELSERDLARKTGVPQRTIHDRKKKVIARLKKMLKI
jgi:RNA polymerase sigma factor, sigma-70 family